MNLRNSLVLDGKQLERLDNLYSRYKRMYEDPDNCGPLFIINSPLEGLPTWEERLADPMVMLKAEIDMLKPHLEMEDDRVPSVRVQFGTAQVAAAFGCDIFIPSNNLPCAGSHVLKNAEDVYKLEKPKLNAGLYSKLEEWNSFFVENLPEGVHIQHPDIQSTFNNAHLIRGNEIFTDFYDNPKALEALLDIITDFMIELVPWLKGMISSDKEWFFDWGALWKGAARISNCSMHMISPQMYVKHVLPRDIRFMKAIGGGRIHYCGTRAEIINEFFKNQSVTGLDYDGAYHDLWEMAKCAPKKMVLLHWEKQEKQEKTFKRLLNGDWPEKRNIILILNVSSVDEGKRILDRLRRSALSSGLI